MDYQLEIFSTILPNIMDHQDLEIKRYIKNWADHQTLPVDGRAKLIKAAAAHKEKRGNMVLQVGVSNLSPNPTFKLKYPHPRNIPCNG